MSTVIVKTPFRISFFGGGTDYLPWFSENNGRVLSTTIDKYCHIFAKRLPPYFDFSHRIVWSQIEQVNNFDEIKHPAIGRVLNYFGYKEGVELHHSSDLPSRSGLGSSSAFVVSLIHALKYLSGQPVNSNRRLGDEAIYIEQKILQEDVGIQDQIAVANGGLNVIEINRDGSYDIQKVQAPSSRIEELERHLLLLFTGVVRNSSSLAKGQIDGIKSKRNDSVYLRFMDMVNEGREILEKNNRDLCDFGKLLDESWRLKASLVRGMSNSYLDEIYQTATNNGAIGGKVLGAGGGGFMIFFVKPSEREKVKNSLRNFINVDFSFEELGTHALSR